MNGIPTKEEIKLILSQREKKLITDSDARPSAVLIPIFEKDGENHILLTKRTENLEHHKGQISFPGGKKEEDDRDMLETALRESFEEIGLRSDAIEIVGELDDELTLTSNFVVSPFVGFIPRSYEFKPNPQEVQEILIVPFSTFTDENNLREETVTEGNSTFPTYFYHYENEVIWGATARILKRFFDLVYDNSQI